MTFMLLLCERYGLNLFSVLDVNRVSSSVVNAVLKEDGMVYGTHKAVFCFSYSAVLT